MRQLDPHDLSWIVRMLPQQLKELMGEAGDRLVLGGGFIRSSVAGERPNDIDLFCKSKEDACSYAAQLAGNKKVIETGNAYSIRKVGGYFVQFIHRWTYDTPRQVLESFDFTIACSAVWFRKDVVSYELGSGETIAVFPDKWTSLVDDNFYSDLAAKRLVYRSPQRNEDAGGSLLRVLKFYQRGFRIPLDSLGAVIARLVDGVDYKGVEVLPNFDCPSSLGDTTEKRWAKIITGLLYVVDPLIDPTHEAHLPSMKETT